MCPHAGISKKRIPSPFVKGGLRKLNPFKGILQLSCSLLKRPPPYFIMQGKITINTLKLFFTALSLLFLASGCVSSRYLQVPGMTEVQLPDLAGRMKTKRVIFIGEVHSESSHHQKQLQIIQTLHRAGFPTAIGLEMLRADSQKDIDKWLSGQMDDDAFLKVYYDNWQIEWPQYRAIFLYAKQNRIPLIGLNIPWSIIRQVVKGGVKSLKPEDSAGLADITCNDADARYRQLIKDAMGEHGKHGKKSGSKKYAFDNFCEAQMVWDISMARRIAGYLKEHPDKNMVVLAGGAHSWRRGIPKQLSRIAGTSLDAAYITVMPELDDTITTDNVTAEDTDYIWTDPWGWLDIGD